MLIQFVTKFRKVYKFMTRPLGYAIAALSVMFLTGGCFSSPARSSIACYDLQMPGSVQKQNKFRLLLCSNNSPGRTRMLYRKADNRILQDDNNCWIQTPEQMLMRYINMAYPGESSPSTAAGKPADLRLTINAFEFNLQTAEAVLSLEYEYKQGRYRKSGTVTIREKSTDSSAGAFSAAMSKAVAKAVTQIAAAAE